MPRLSQLFTCLAVCLAFAVGCGPPAPGGNSEAQLRQALQRATAVEIQLAAGGVRADSTQRALDRAGAILSARTGKSAAVIEGLAGGDSRTPRIVVGTLEDPQLVKLIEELGAEILDAPFFHGNALRGGRARWELRGLDPERPGLPITVYLGVRWKALENTLDNLRVGGRPGVTMFTLREGRREFDWRGRVRGALFEETENWAVPPQLETQALALHVGARVPIGRATAYQAKATAALDHIAEWAGAPIENQLHVYLVEDAGYLRAYAQASDLAVSLGLRNHRIGLMTRAVPHDGGACVASWAAKDLLGPALAPWMQTAVGVDAAGTWWGRDVEAWGKHLLGAELLPALSDIVDSRGARSISQHQLIPARALLLRYLRVTEGPEFVRALWDGESDVDPACEPAFRQWLSESEAPIPERNERESSGQEFLTGVALDSSGQLGGGLDGTELPQSLASAVDAGVNSLSITSYFRERSSGQGAFHGALLGGGRQASEGDIALAQAVVQARRAGVGHIALQPHVLLSDSAGHSAWQRRTSPDHWREFFDGQHPALVHYALLGELCRIDLLCIGTGLSRRNANRSLTKEAHQTYVDGWIAAIDAVRAAYSGKLTYAADWDGEAESYQLWDKLDYIGLSYFPNLKPLGTTEPAKPYLDTRWDTVLEMLDALAATHGKPALLMEFGARSVTQGSNETAIGTGAADARVQLRYFEALQEALDVRRANGKSAPNSFGGLFAWKWSARATTGGSADRGFSLQGKPAATVLRTLAPAQ